MMEGELPGFLSLTPSPQSVDNSWYFDYHGPALVKEVTGNFAIVTSVAATSFQGGESEPSGLFNSGGVLIRDVWSVEGNENWMNFNLGRQASDYGREIKKTVVSGSNSFQNAQAENTEHLLVCRVGTQFRFYHWDDAVGGWAAERFDNEVATAAGVSTTEINDLYDASRNPELDLPPPGESIEIVLEFPGISATVQVGVMINSWGTPHDVTSAFDYIRMGSIIPESPSDCTAELTPD